MKYKPRLKEKFIKEISPKLKEEFQYKNEMEVPELVKICLNQGVGDAITDKKILEIAVEQMSSVAGQAAVQTVSKKDVSNFKLRRGMPIGCRTTLRRDKMYEFLDRFISVTVPRIRDFKGIDDKGFDGRGNFTMGVSEQIIFPEINIDKVDKIMGMDIIFVTTAKTDKEAHALLREFGFPFKNIKT